MRIAAFFVALALTPSGAAQTPTAPAPTLTATFVGNEAWHITDGEYTLMTDFPYQSGYSRYMTWEWSGVPKVKDPAKLLVVTTHQHRDHFAAELLSRLNPAGVIGPATVRAAAPTKGIAPAPDARFGPIRVEAITTPHADLEHYSYVIEWHGVRIYLPGDTEGTESLIEAKNLDVAFVTPWMLRAAERAGAKIDARRVIVVHHEASETVATYQGSTVPRQGDVLLLQPKNPGGQAGTTRFDELPPPVVPGRPPPRLRVGSRREKRDLDHECRRLGSAPDHVLPRRKAPAHRRAGIALNASAGAASAVSKRRIS